MWSMHNHHGFASHLLYMFRNTKTHSPSSFDSSRIESLRDVVTSVLPVAALLPLPQNCSNIWTADSCNTTWSRAPMILVTLSKWTIKNLSQHEGGDGGSKECDGSGRVQSDKNCPLKIPQQEIFLHHLLTLQKPSHFKVSVPTASV